MSLSERMGRRKDVKRAGRPAMSEMLIRTRGIGRLETMKTNAFRFSVTYTG